MFHWYERGAVPVAVTLNVAVAGAVTVWFWGWAVIDGATAGGGGGEELPPPPQPEATKTMTETRRAERIRAAQLLRAPGLDMGYLLGTVLGFDLALNLLGHRLLVN